MQGGGQRNLQTTDWQGTAGTDAAQTDLGGPICMRIAAHVLVSNAWSCLPAEGPAGKMGPRPPMRCQVAPASWQPESTPKTS